MTKLSAHLLEGLMVAGIVALAWVAPWHHGWMRGCVAFLLLWGSNIGREGTR
jgi:hypothetical protein